MPVSVQVIAGSFMYLSILKVIILQKVVYKQKAVKMKCQQTFPKHHPKARY